MSEDTINHAQFDLPKADPSLYGATHPLRNKDMHEKLVDYIKQRLRLGKDARDVRLRKYTQIDRDVAAFMKLSDEDQKRVIKHIEDGTPQATAISLPLMFVHLDDMMTYYAQTFAPNRGMFYHTAEHKVAEDAIQLVALMNSHAIYGGFYKRLLRAIYAILKYNEGGVINEWETEKGPKLEMNPDGTVADGTQIVFAGNKIESVDMYNLLCDPSVELSELYKDGEFAATAKMRSHYWLKQRCLDGVYVNCDDILRKNLGGMEASYYKHPPIESRLDSDETRSGQFSWYSSLSGEASYMSNGAFELVTIYLKLNPNDFNLIDKKEAGARNRYEIWRFTLLNGERIIETKHVNNMHGHIPMYFGVLNDSDLQDAAKSVAEILNPLQQFSSFLLNTHVLANRKNIYGTTFYDPSCVDLDKVPQGEVAARVPIKPQGRGKDIRTMVMHDSKTLDTQQTLRDLQGMMGLIDQFFPTQSMPSQIAGIDRAVDSQVAAVQQGSNRRQHKGARLIDDTMLRPMRFSMYYNIIQFQKDNEQIADFYTGKEITIQLDKLKNINLSLIIGQGLKALDRQAIQQQMREIIFALIQAPQTAQGIDLLAMLDAWTTMMDLEMNLKQFQLQPPAEAAPQPDSGLTTGTGVVPATAPANIAGGPIYD